MKLTIPERLALLNVLPAQGDIVTLRIMQELKMNLSFSEEEMGKWKISMKAVDGGTVITWDEDFKNETKDIEIGKTAAGVIKQGLLELDQRKQLRVDMIPLYEKFVEANTEKA